MYKTPKNTEIVVICYEKGWIIEAIAKQIYEKLLHNFNVRLEYDTTQLSTSHSSTYFHIYYLNAKLKCNARNIVYVTHIDSFKKTLKIISLSRFQGDVEFMCMSFHTASFLKKIIKDRPIYAVTPKSIHFSSQNIPKNITLGLFFRMYSDNRKSWVAVEYLFELADKYSTDLSLVIFGDGYQKLISKYTNVVIKKYYESFNDIKSYENALLMCDYVIAYGKDEGYFSVLDATSLNIKILAIDQGFHRDLSLAKGSLLFSSHCQLNQYLKNLVSSFSVNDNLEILDLDRFLFTLSEPKIPLRPQSLLNKLFHMFETKNDFRLNSYLFDFISLFNIRKLLK